MKRTKKSLIIAPALGVLLLASVGSVSGTVAWFSSVSSFDTTISSFAVTHLDGNLDAVMTPQIGMQYTSGASTGDASSNARFHKVIETKSNYTLTHASFDHISGHLYCPSESGGFRDLGNTYATESNWLHRTGTLNAQTVNEYFGFSWQITFTYTFTGDVQDMNLYFDNTDRTGSLMQKTNSDVAVGGKETYKGFRIAFVGSAKDPSSAAYTTRVWADNEASTKCQHIAESVLDGTPADNYGEITHGTDYTGSYLIDSTNSAKVSAEGVATSNTGNTYLGTFVPNASTPKTSTLTFQCVAWFEGTDENVINASSMDTVLVSMKFYTRPKASV